MQRVAVGDPERQPLSVALPDAVAAALVEPGGIEVLARLVEIEFPRLDFAVVVLAEAELESRQALVVAAQHGFDDAVEVHCVRQT